MAKIINEKDILENQKVEGAVRTAVVYKNNNPELLAKAKGEPEVLHSEDYKIGKGQWQNSEGRTELYREIRKLQEKLNGGDVHVNSASAPDISALTAKLYIDVQRLSDDLADYSPEFVNVIRRPDLQEINYLRDLVPYVGDEADLSGNNDPVPLIQQMTASTETITMGIKGFGWKGSLKNTLFNSLHNMQRVNETAARIQADGKNAQSIGAIIAPTYHANYSQAADATGTTYDEKMYNTLRKGIKKLGTFTHPLTGLQLAQLGTFLNNIKVLCSPVDAWSINRVASGELNSRTLISSPLPIAKIIPYGGGVQNGLPWGLKTISKPGVAAGVAYLVLPLDLGGFVAHKVEGQMELANGDPLSLATEVKSWYRVTGSNLTSWMLYGAASGSGGCLVCKVTLPTDS